MQKIKLCKRLQKHHQCVADPITYNIIPIYNIIYYTLTVNTTQSSSGALATLLTTKYNSTYLRAITNFLYLVEVLHLSEWFRFWAKNFLLRSGFSWGNKMRWQINVSILILLMSVDFPGLKNQLDYPEKLKKIN